MTVNKMGEINPDTCLSCGACCFSPYDQEWFADLEPGETKRFTKKQVIHDALKTIERKMADGVLKGTSLHVCCCLDGSVMHRVSCNAYEKRPSACKRFQPGSFGCRILRMGVVSYSSIESKIP